MALPPPAGGLERADTIICVLGVKPRSVEWPVLLERNTFLIHRDKADKYSCFTLRQHKMCAVDVYTMVCGQ